MNAGYSGKPLIQKLGIKPSSSLLLINEPANYPELLGTDISLHLTGNKLLPDIIHLFVTNKISFEKELAKLEPVYRANPNVVIWISWYKKAAGISTDVTESVIRDRALQLDLVDVKVCAVDEIWSALKLVVRKSKR